MEKDVTIRTPKYAVEVSYKDNLNVEVTDNDPDLKWCRFDRTNTGVNLSFVKEEDRTVYEDEQLALLACVIFNLIAHQNSTRNYRVLEV